MNSQENIENKIAVCRLKYLIILLLFVIVFVVILWVISAKSTISENALTNFSFAATLISIVLAVVSIIYSLQSGFDVYNQTGNIREIEERINNNISKFDSIEKNIKDAIDEKYNKIWGIQDSNFQKSRNNASTDDKGISKKYNVISMLVMYIAVCAYKKNKSFSKDIIQPIDENFQFGLGYFSALSGFGKSVFSYEVNADNIRVNKYDEEKIAKEEYLRNYLDDQKESINQLKECLNTIDNSFNDKQS